MLAACGEAAGGVAATVNGVDISVSDVEAMRISEEATIDKVAFAEDLTNAIINIAVVTAARDEFSIEPTTEEIAVKKEELASQLEEAQGTLRQVSDEGELGAIVDRVLEEHADAAAKVRAGNDGVLGFLVGQVMKASGGSANPALARELLRARLSG